MRFRVLGPVEAFDEPGNPVVLTGAKERTLLAALLVSPGEVVSTDRLIDILWPHAPPSNPANALQARISALRRSLRDSAVIVTQPPGYRLDVSPDDVDATCFEVLLAEARKSAAAGSAGAVDLYEQALKLWAGPPFADFAYRDFARPEMLRLEELWTTAQEERIDVMLRAGRHGEILADLEGLVLEHPLRERFRGQLMLALYRSGRQADALRAYTDTARLLGEELGIEPSPDLRHLEEAILTQDPVIAGPTTAVIAHNLPSRITSLIGRTEDIERVVDLLDRHRLVTLTGPGGVGKSSLALACAEESLQRFPHGAWLIELAAVTDPSLVPMEIARSLTLDIGDRSTLDVVADFVRDRELTLIMDNCEHLADAVADAIQVILRRAPKARVIATSREPIGVPGEVLWPTRPLPTPDEISDQSLESFDSVRLFVERARSVDPEFALDASTAPAVADICRRLDGLPLALELAASRVRALPVHEIAARLDDRFSLLTGSSRTVLPRQMTLDATISWSYGMLSDSESDLLRRLSVFAAGWPLEAAEAIAGDMGDVLAVLSHLVDRSLVITEHSGERPRYSMLETIREFASRELAASGTEWEMVRRHAEWYLALAESAEFQGPDQARWERALSAEHENLRLAVTRSVGTGQLDTALRLGSALGWWWFFGNRDEGRALLDHLLSSTTDVTGPTRARALLARARLDLFSPSISSGAAASEALRLAIEGGHAALAAEARVLDATRSILVGNTAESVRALEEALEFFVSDGNAWGEGLARFQLMEAEGHRGDLRSAIAWGEQALTTFRRTGDPWAVSAALAHLAKFGRLTGRVGWARPKAEEALRVSQDRGLPHTVQYVMTHLAYLHLLDSNPADALTTLQEALAIAEDAGNLVGVAENRNGVAECHVAAGSLAEAREWHEKALADFEQLDLSNYLAYTLARTGMVSEMEGDGEEAADRYRRGVEIATGYGHVIELIPCLEGLGRLALSAGDSDHAARLLRAGAALRERTGLAPMPSERAANEAAESRLSASLGPDALGAIMEELIVLDPATMASMAR